MKTVALVPIKLNNERTPGKNTKCFADGTPLIKICLKTLVKCKEVDEIYVYCSDESIKSYLIPGIRYKKRDKRFDAQDINVNEMFFEFSEAVPADIYVLVHATAPFQKSTSIDRAIKKVKSGEYDSAFAVEKSQHFAWKENRPLNYDSENIPLPQNIEPVFVETTGLYVFTRDVIRKKHCRIGDRPFLLEMSKMEAVDINYPVDFEIANSIYMSRMKNLGGGGEISFSCIPTERLPMPAT